MAGYRRQVDARLQGDVLEELAAAVNYRRWICDLASPWLGPCPLEIGSGRGDYAAEWAERGHRVTASEADPARVADLRARFWSHARVGVRELAAPVRETAGYSAVVAVNVLEHIDDDVSALRSFGGLVAPGGRVVVFVPAFPVAMSDFDRRIGHFRRYRRASLRAAAAAAGLTVERLHYVNSAGLPAWIVLVRLLRGRPREGMALRVFDQLLVPLLRRVESFVRPPFGQSLFLVARTDDPGKGCVERRC